MEKVGSPEKIGHFNIYIRESIYNDLRRPLQQLRYPAAVYSRNRLRTYLLILSFLPWRTIWYSFEQSIYKLPIDNANFYASSHSSNDCFFTKWSQYVSIFWKSHSMKLFFCTVYLFPKFYNAYGQVFSLGELLASGYASFISNSFGMPAFVDIATVFRPVICKGWSA